MLKLLFFCFRNVRFLNPLYQNFLHIQCLKKNIGSTDVPIYSLVVFADRCDISKVRFSRPNTAVTSFSRMCAQIVLLSASSHCMFSNEEIQNLCDKVKSVAGTPQEYKELLISGINEKKQTWKKAVYVRYKDRHPSKKGLTTGTIYKVLEDDGECYRLEGISGKTLKSRFEICNRQDEEVQR